MDLSPPFFVAPMVILSPFMGRQDLFGSVAGALKSDSRPCNKDIDGAFAYAQPLNMTMNFFCFMPCTLRHDNVYFFVEFDG